MSQAVITHSVIGPYLLKETIGEGAFSIVKLAYNTDDKVLYACKIVPKARLKNPKLISRFENEIRIHQQMHNPCIVQLTDVLKDSLNYYVFIEFCPNGELFQYVAERGRLSEEESKPFIIQILTAVNYIHNLGVSHRDLKLENILLDQHNQVKISDFGLSHFLNDNNLVQTPCGSPCYASPECISGFAYDGCKTDIWSIGVIVYAMLIGRLPWTKTNQIDLFKQISKGEYEIPEFLSPLAQSFIRGLMEVDCTKRMTIAEALSHSFLRNSPHIHTTSPIFHTPSIKKLDHFFDPNQTQAQITTISYYRQKTQSAGTFQSVLKSICNPNQTQIPPKIHKPKSQSQKLILKPIGPQPDPLRALGRRMPRKRTKFSSLKPNDPIPIKKIPRPPSISYHNKCFLMKKFTTV